MEQVEIDSLLDRLRRIRLAADDARNLDVLLDRFVGGDRGGIPAKILEKIGARRREVQGAIMAVYEEIAPKDWEREIEQLLQQIESRGHGEGKRPFGRLAPKCFAASVKKFFNAAESNLASEESLHALRIRTKKLRYRMEIVAVAFDSSFRKRLYAQVTHFQDLLGALNDHVTAQSVFQDLRSETESAEEAAFFDGMLLAGQRAVADLRSAFFAVWTPNAVSDLKRQFRSQCRKCKL
jgi:CHAD domain-containing protein